MVFIHLYICIYIFSAICSYTGEYSNYFIDWTEYGGGFRNFAMDMLDTEMVVNMMKTVVDSKTKGKKSVHPHVTCMVYSCLGMVAVV